MSTIDKPPEGWAKDPLSTVLQLTAENSYAVFHHAKRAFSIWQRVYALYMLVRDNVSGVQPWFPALFVARGYGAWIAAIRLASAGQLPESYMVLRGCLENALYAFFVHDDPSLPGSPDRAYTWLQRDVSGKWRKKVRREFSPKAMCKQLKAKNQEIGNMAERLYEISIDHGAHPNPAAFLTNLQFDQTSGGYTLTTEFTNPDPTVRGLCWKCAAMIGVCTLDVFGLIWPDLLQRLDIPQQLDGLRPDIENADNWRVILPSG